MTTSNTHFDVIIIGSGTSAYYAATGLLAAKKKIAIIDERPFGGTCALRGCQPKKYLVANAEAVANAEHLVGKGIESAPRTDWKALQALKDEFLDGRSEEDLKDWQEQGVATFRHRATLSGPNEVTLDDGRQLTAEHIILATGSSPRPTNILGAEHIHISDDFLTLPELPRHITFIGGGYISFEFAHVAIRAGAQVTLLHRSDRPLNGFDSNMVDVVLAASREAGIDIVLEESAVSVEKTKSSYQVTTSTGRIIETDFIVSATGRVPNLSVLESDVGNVAHGRDGVEVNDHLQSTTNPAVYAIGDCADHGLMLATVADDHGKIVSRNILEGNTTAVVHSVVPSAVFTIPSLATVGLTEEQARSRGLDFRVKHGRPTGWPSSKRIGETHAAFKVLIDNKTDFILGAHLVRHNAAEVINLFALAMAYEIPAKDIANFLWAYPTSSSDIKSMV
ncbi:NAD(P)/FAD-dependent oxidoreductase [Roseibacillus persicicus]|uniref:dihydrolipoyl dehydrogenase family protein n=1 Tax=Roseibacillus persicicus TaxID=454148 RepID=UPI00398BBC57